MVMTCVLLFLVVSDAGFAKVDEHNRIWDASSSWFSMFASSEGLSACSAVAAEGFESHRLTGQCYRYPMFNSTWSSYSPSRLGLYFTALAGHDVAIVVCTMNLTFVSWVAQSRCGRKRFSLLMGRSTVLHGSHCKSVSRPARATWPKQCCQPA